MNVFSVTQYIKPRFKDIQDKQKIAWITGISVSVILNITLAVLCGVWNNKLQKIQSDKKSLQNQLYQCEHSSQKTCNNTIYKAGDKIILFNYSQEVQPSNLNNITDTIEIKDNGDIYINDQPSGSNKCGYYKIGDETFYINGLQTAPVQDINNKIYLDQTQLKIELETDTIQKQQIYPINETILGDTLYVTDNKFTIQGPGDYSLSVADNKVTRDETQIYPLQEIYTTFNNEIIQIKPSNGILYSGDYSKVLLLNTNNTIQFNNDQIYPIDENVLGDKLYVNNNKYTTQGPGDYSLSVTDNKITKDETQIYPFKDTVYTSINGNNYMIQTPTDELFQWAQLDNPTQIKFLENGTITINDKETTTETCKELPEEIYYKITTQTEPQQEFYYKYDITNFIKEPTENIQVKGEIINSQVNDDLQIEYKQNDQVTIIFPVQSTQIIKTLYLTIDDQNEYQISLPDEVYQTPKQAIQQGKLYVTNYDYNDQLVLEYEINQESQQIFPLMNNINILTNGYYSVFEQDKLADLTIYQNGEIIERNNKQIYPMNETILGDTLYVTNNKYTTQGPGDYSLSVADNKITKDDIQIWPLNEQKIYIKSITNDYYKVDTTNLISQNGIIENGVINIEQSNDYFNLPSIKILNKNIFPIITDGVYVLNETNQNKDQNKLYKLYNSTELHYITPILNNNFTYNSNSYTYTNIENEDIILTQNTIEKESIGQIYPISNQLYYPFKLSPNEDNETIVYYRVNFKDDIQLQSKSPLNESYTKVQGEIELTDGTISNTLITIKGSYGNSSLSTSPIYISNVLTGENIIDSSINSAACKINYFGFCLEPYQNTNIMNFYNVTYETTDQGVETEKIKEKKLYLISIPQNKYLEVTNDTNTSMICPEGVTCSYGGTINMGKGVQVTLSGTFGNYDSTGSVITLDQVELLGQNEIKGISLNTNTININCKIFDIGNNLCINPLPQTIYSQDNNGENIYKISLPNNIVYNPLSQTVQGTLILNNNYQLSLQGQFGIETQTPTIDIKYGVKLLSSECEIMNGTTCIGSNSSDTNKISFKYSKNNINYYYTLSGPQENIYQGDLPPNSSTDIISTVELGNYQQLNIYGTYGDQTETDTGITITPLNIYGKINSISIDNIDGKLNNQININTNINSASQGILIDSGISFKNCQNGIRINGKVNGTNSGIYIDGDVGDVQYSTYGIYQNSGTIQGKGTGFYQQGTINGNNNGIQVNGTVKSKTSVGIKMDSGVSFVNCQNGIYIVGKVNGTRSGIYIDGDVGDVQYSNYGIYQNSGTIQGKGTGFYQSQGTMYGNNHVIHVNGIIKGNNSWGISIGASVSFVNCQNGIQINGNVIGSIRGIYVNADVGDVQQTQYGIYINGKVIGSNSGIYISGNIGDTEQSNYGIYQKSGYIQGKQTGFYQDRSCNIYGGSNGISVNGTIQSNNGITVGSSAILNATSCKIVNGNTCLLDP